jgi:hypothetical protein
MTEILGHTIVKGNIYQQPITVVENTKTASGLRESSGTP